MSVQSTRSDIWTTQDCLSPALNRGHARTIMRPGETPDIGGMAEDILTTVPALLFQMRTG